MFLKTKKNHTLVSNVNSQKDAPGNNFEQQETIDLVNNESFEVKDAPGTLSTNKGANIGTHKYKKSRMT